LAGGARGNGYDTRSSAFKLFRADIDHYSEEWENAPMPYSIFFTQTGNAIHGTYERRSLGHPVSHGCVRLSLKNYAALGNIVKQEKIAHTIVVLRGAIPRAGVPLPLAADDPSYDEPLPRHQRDTASLDRRRTAIYSSRQ